MPAPLDGLDVLKLGRSPVGSCGLGGEGEAELGFAYTCTQLGSRHEPSATNF